MKHSRRLCVAKANRASAIVRAIRSRERARYAAALIADGASIRSVAKLLGCDDRALGRAIAKLEDRA